MINKRNVLLGSALALLSLTLASQSTAIGQWIANQQCSHQVTCSGTGSGNAILPSGTIPVMNCIYTGGIFYECEGPSLSKQCSPAGGPAGSTCVGFVIIGGESYPCYAPVATCAEAPYP